MLAADVTVARLRLDGAGRQLREEAKHGATDISAAATARGCSQQLVLEERKRNFDKIENEL